MSRPPRPPSGRPASPTARPTARPAGSPAVRTATHRPTASSAARAAATHRPAPVEVPSGADLRSSAIGGAPRWVSGLLAGVQAALLSLLVVVTPSLAAYVATSADPANSDVGWLRSVAVGATLWLMGHGGAVQVDGVAVTLVPLGITVLALFGAYASARRTAVPVRSAWLAGIGGYLGVVGLVTLGVGSTGPIGAGVGALLRTLIGATAVAAAGLALGMVSPGGWRLVTRPLWSRVPPLVRAGVRAGTMVAASVVAVAALLVASWVVAGRAEAGDVVDGLGVDVFSGLVLAVAQLAVAPNLVLWGVAWLAGPGFAVGAGTVFAPAEVTSGPLPALPLLGALPKGAGGLMVWTPVVVVAVGCLAGWWLHRRLTPGSWRRPFAAGGVVAAVAGVLTALLVAVSGGAIGPGRLAVVGSSSLLVGGSVAALSLIGSLLVAVPADAEVRAAVSRLAGRARKRLRPVRVSSPSGRADAPAAAPGAASGAAPGTSVPASTPRVNAVADAATDDG